MKAFFFVAFLCSFFVSAQVVNKTDSNRVKPQDSLVIDSGVRDSMKIFKPTIYDYQMRTQFSEKRILDTVLTIDKTYIFSQYNNRDNFGKVQFANIGSGFNPLVFELEEEQNLTLLPKNKSFVYLGIKDILYYDVKTPTTMFVYHNGVRNGAALKTTYTQNIGKRFNFAIEYMGLRSEGHYKNSLAGNNNTLFSAHYLSENGKYEAFGHFIHQNVNNEEYGGIANNQFFIDDDENSRNNRQNMEVNLQYSNSRFRARRYYLSHQFSPFNTEKLPFKLRHTIFHQGNKYYYSQSQLEPFYYDANSDLTNHLLSTGKYSKNLSNTASLVFDNEKFKLDAGVRHQLLKLGISDAVMTGEINVPKELNENRIGAVGNLGIDLWNKIELNSNLEYSTGDTFGNFLRSANQLKFEPLKDYFVDAKVNFQSASPSFNYLLNSSVYRKFNYHFSDFQNENSLEIGGTIGLKWFKSQLFANYFRVDNFAYFDQNGQPNQSDRSLNISQIGGEATFSYGKFNLNAKLLFQNTLTKKELFPAPNFVGRANIFYQSKAFKNAAEVQTGIKTYFFSKFNSRDYFPVLNEFILRETPFSIGGEPIVDAYFNLKVKRMFFFIEGQQLTDLFSANKSYTAPIYPFYDFRLNIGIVWYLIN